MFFGQNAMIRKSLQNVADDGFFRSAVGDGDEVGFGFGFDVQCFTALRHFEQRRAAGLRRGYRNLEQRGKIHLKNSCKCSKKL
ncbi:MAG: hypothetical protein ALAOOOJD_03063 [bacterium]|nr:hypothetical protein [bacterium]